MMRKFKETGFSPQLGHTIIRPPKTMSSIRLYGPLDTKLSRFEASLGDSVYGIVTTTYPREAIKTKEGLDLYESSRLGMLLSFVLVLMFVR